MDLVFYFIKETGEMAMEKISLFETLDKVREVNPLVHNITNVVVTNFTANGLLALGASPVMAYLCRGSGGNGQNC